MNSNSSHSDFIVTHVPLPIGPVLTSECGEVHFHQRESVVVCGDVSGCDHVFSFGE